MKLGGATEILSAFNRVTKPLLALIKRTLHIAK